MLLRICRHGALALAIAASLLRLPASDVRADAPGEVLVGPVLLVSGANPYPPACEGAEAPGQRLSNTEVEPHLAIDPRDPHHLVGAWQQDRWTTGGAAGLRTAVTWDGGATWTASAAAFTTCSGGSVDAGTNFQRASDPWVTFAPNGDVYQAALAVNVARDGSFADSAILVSKSADGGRTWEPPVTVRYDQNLDQRGSGFNDKETITADPADPAVVYAVWNRIESVTEDAAETGRQPADGAPAYFSRTVDGGRTWEPARAIVRSGYTISNQIVVLPDGQLVNAFLWTIADSDRRAEFRRVVAVVTSADRGVTWTRPVIVDDVAAIAPEGPAGQVIRPPIALDVAADPVSGAVYLVWQEAGYRSGRIVDVALSRSVDGGQTWSETIVVNRQAPGTGGFVPKVIARADGVVGVTYYEYATAGPAPGIPTTYRLAYCRTACDRAARWEDAQVAGPFDLGAAPQIGGSTTPGLFVGDYNGLVASGDRFLTLFALGPAGSDTVDRASVYFTTVAIAGP